MEDCKCDAKIDGACSSYPSVVERYFKHKYKTDLNGKPEEDHCILVHSNRICIVTLASSHPILKYKKQVTKVNFQVTDNTNRLENKVSGKFKKGAQWLMEASPLCHVTCSDQSIYTVYSCLQGSLVEVNERLISKPELLTQKPSTEGFVGIIFTRLKQHERELSRLATPEQYQDILDKRRSESAV